MKALQCALVLVALLSTPGVEAVQPGSMVFVGSTPAGESIRQLLEIPAGAAVDLIEWQLALTESAGTGRAPAYHLRYRFGPARPNQPGLDDRDERRERRGVWRSEARLFQRSASSIIVLDDRLELLRVSDSLLHLLDREARLMVGNGGWSYTLVRRDAVEPAVDAQLAAADPGDAAGRTTTRASGPTVYGIFDGRTPCQGIARELGVPARPGCWKAKWRLTLFQDPSTRQPASYRLEGTLYRSAPREGVWRILRRPAARYPEVYELAAAGSEAPVLLLKGDDGVLFFLDRQQRPMAGTAGNAYTLDRMPTDRR
jgi:hypothetical protein